MSPRPATSMKKAPMRSVAPARYSLNDALPLQELGVHHRAHEAEDRQGQDGDDEELLAGLDGEQGDDAEDVRREGVGGHHPVGGGRALHQADEAQGQREAEHPEPDLNGGLDHSTAPITGSSSPSRMPSRTSSGWVMCRAWTKIVLLSSEMSTLRVPGVRVMEFASSVTPKGVRHRVL